MLSCLTIHLKVAWFDNQTLLISIIRLIDKIAKPFILRHNNDTRVELKET